MSSTVDGVTRMAGIRRELERVINALSDDVYFNVVADNKQPRIWSLAWVQATPIGKSMAIQTAHALEGEQRTETYNVLESALRENSGNLEVIVLLSDGRPAAGTITDRPTIVRMITFQNAFSRVSINAVGNGTRGDELDFLDRLTANNDGVLKVIR